MINWFKSKTHRRAVEMNKQVRKILAAQRDILSDEKIAAIRVAESDLASALKRNAPDEELQSIMDAVEKTANSGFRPYPHAAIRENIEVLLVAVAVALGIRSFFLQPFKIPTGSMQPTLYGITVENMVAEHDGEIPGFFERVWDRCVNGTSYYELRAGSTGRIRFEQPRTILPFVLSRQRVWIGDEPQTVWNPPQDLGNTTDLATMLRNNGVRPGRTYAPGDIVYRMKLVRGDYLFVDRFTYNFRRPKRGEIIVFETKGIVGLKQDQFYIKRLIGLPGDEIRIGDDRHLVINGERLDADTPHFENLYGFDPSTPPRENEYSGHVNGEVGRRNRLPYAYSVAQRFPNEHTTYTIQDNHYMAMGDNTMNSLDGRNWGDFPEKNVMGRFSFVFWPFTSRFGFTVE